MHECWTSPVEYKEWVSVRSRKNKRKACILVMSGVDIFQRVGAMRQAETTLAHQIWSTFFNYWKISTEVLSDRDNSRGVCKNPQLPSGISFT